MKVKASEKEQSFHGLQKKERDSSDDMKGHWKITEYIPIYLTEI